MASRIDPLSNGYNQLFPTSGVNQSAQGFRNNFSSIYNNLYIAKNEISILHDKTFNFDVSGSDIIETSTTVPRLVVDGQESAPVSLKLTFRPNPVFPGTQALTVVKGTTAQRPSAPVEGMIRYNTTTKKMEFFVDAEWVTIGSSAGGSSFFNVSGDTITGNLVMDNSNPLQVAQVLGDDTYVTNKPAFSFNGDTDTGVSHPGQNEVSIVTGGQNRVVINNTTANFSPNWPDSNTEIHGQLRGFRQSKEVFVYVENRNANVWVDLLSWDTGTAVDYKTVSLNCDFMCSGISYAGGVKAFSISGVALASYIFVREILENSTDPVTPPTLVAGTPSVMSQQSLRSVVSANMEFRIVYNNGAIVFQGRCTNDIGGNQSLPFDFSGKITVHYGNLGVYPMTPVHD